MRAAERLTTTGKDLGDPDPVRWSSGFHEATRAAPDQAPWRQPEPETVVGRYWDDADITRDDLPPVRDRRAGVKSWALLPVAAIVLLVVIVAAGFALGPRTRQGSRAATWTAGRTATSPPSVLAGGGAAPQASVAPSTTAAADPGPTAPAARRGGASATYEAEAASNTSIGSAVVAAYPGASGGQIVKNIGTWGNPAGPGSLTFVVSARAAGAYLLTFFYVHLNGDATRTVVITVSGFAPVTVQVTAGAACCSQRTVTVHLAAGADTITFANRKGHAPAIDKIKLTPKLA
ncbi:MAG: hypothetical protein V7603_6766 [Micromonosporaceae bacterium]